MEDKSFELFTKMYADMVEQFRKINEKLDNKADKTDIVRIEDKLAVHSTALFDGYNQVFEKQQEHDKMLDNLDHKIDELSIRMNSQEAKFEVLEGGKKKTL